MKLKLLNPENVKRTGYNMFPTTIIDKSIAHRAWKIALSKSFIQNSNCPEWFKINLSHISKLVENKFKKLVRRN